MQSRVALCMQRVEDILDLKFCTDGVQTALQDEDYEKVIALTFLNICIHFIVCLSNECMHYIVIPVSRLCPEFRHFWIPILRITYEQYQ